jgi:hypothetical protein
MSRRCVYCREDVEVVLWVFDGVQDEPVPACRDCRDKYRLKVHRVELLDSAGLPQHPDCEYCGRPLPIPDTEPVVAWVKDVRGVVAVCDACRVQHDLTTLWTVAPERSVVSGLSRAGAR